MKRVCVVKKQHYTKQLLNNKKSKNKNNLRLKFKIWECVHFFPSLLLKVFTIKVFWMDFHQGMQDADKGLDLHVKIAGSDVHTTCITKQESTSSSTRQNTNLNCADLVTGCCIMSYTDRENVCSAPCYTTDASRSFVCTGVCWYPLISWILEHLLNIEQMFFILLPPNHWWSPIFKKGSPVCTVSDIHLGGRDRTPVDTKLRLYMHA